MKPSHYIAAYAQTRGIGRHKDQVALCGAWADPHTEHSVDPTCTTCAVLLAQDEAEAQALEAQWAREDAARGGKSCS
jgi:hypothetical protein